MKDQHGGTLSPNQSTQFVPFSVSAISLAESKADSLSARHEANQARTKPHGEQRENSQEKAYPGENPERRLHRAELMSSLRILIRERSGHAHVPGD